jgi:DNA-binding LacI/PurR family transcriptional regulator
MNVQTAMEPHVRIRDTDGSRASIVDVARAAGVSRQTVSNAFNNPERVAPDTLERVRREIKRLGFRPSLAARSLRRRKAHALGFQLNAGADRTLGNVLDPFLVEATIAARRHDAHLITFAVGPDQDIIGEYEHLIATRMVDGFLLTNTGHDDPRPAWLQSQNVPFASFGRIWDDPTYTGWVDVDGGSGTRAAVRHLIEQGYERVGFLGWPVGSPVGDERRAGWLTGCHEQGVLDAALQVSSLQDVGAAAHAVAPLIGQLGSGGALVCASDTLALGAYTVLRDERIAIGPDFGLVGFDDTDLARALGVSSVQQPLGAIAEAVLNVVINLEDGKTPTATGLVLDPLVMARGSSQRSPVHSATLATTSSAGDRALIGGS